MGSSDTLTVCIGSDPITSDHLWNFSTRLVDNEYVIDAFMDSAYEADQWSAAALFHYENSDDTLLDVGSVACSGISGDLITFKVTGTMIL